MQRTLVGLAFVAALGLLTAGVNFGCAPNSSDQAAPGSGAMVPASPGVATVSTAPGGAKASGATVNNRCPMTLTPIDPNNVPDSKVRYYKGMKVGFCCGGHPELWDKLSDAEKDAKLAVVMAPPSQPTTTKKPG
jgi:hypothetical protein